MGTSKLPRLLRVFAHRFTVQERIGTKPPTLQPRDMSGCQPIREKHGNWISGRACPPAFASVRPSPASKVEGE